MNPTMAQAPDRQQQTRRATWMTWSHTCSTTPTCYHTFTPITSSEAHLTTTATSRKTQRHVTTQHLTPCLSHS